MANLFLLISNFYAELFHRANDASESPYQSPKCQLLPQAPHFCAGNGPVVSGEVLQSIQQAFLCTKLSHLYQKATIADSEGQGCNFTALVGDWRSLGSWAGQDSALSQKVTPTEPQLVMPTSMFELPNLKRRSHIHGAIACQWHLMADPWHSRNAPPGCLNILCSSDPLFLLAKPI